MQPHRRQQSEFLEPINVRRELLSTPHHFGVESIATLNGFRSGAMRLRRKGGVPKQITWNLDPEYVPPNTPRSVPRPSIAFAEEDGKSGACSSGKSVQTSSSVERAGHGETSKGAFDCQAVASSSVQDDRRQARLIGEEGEGPGSSQREKGRASVHPDTLTRALYRTFAGQARASPEPPKKAKNPRKNPAASSSPSSSEGGQFVAPSKGKGVRSVQAQEEAGQEALPQSFVSPQFGSLDDVILSHRYPLRNKTPSREEAGFSPSGKQALESGAPSRAEPRQGRAYLIEKDELRQDSPLQEDEVDVVAPVLALPKRGHDGARPGKKGELGREIRPLASVDGGPSCSNAQNKLKGLASEIDGAQVQDEPILLSPDPSPEREDPKPATLSPTELNRESDREASNRPYVTSINSAMTGTLFRLENGQIALYFKATRSDGKEVMLDNHFLREKYPELLLDFYEQNLYFKIRV